jgi:dihydrofolate reductase
MRKQKLRVPCFGISVDGYGAGPKQSLEHPLGVGGTELMEWFFPTRTFHKMTQARKSPGLKDVAEQVFGAEHGETGMDDEFAAGGFENIGGWIMGRNMFGPIRGEWANDDWKGWWGDNPPFHCDVFVLTHHARETLRMEGGTTFHFVTDGIEAAWERAKEAAKVKDVRVGGGVATIRAYLQAGLVDELHLAQSPTVLGSGESLFRDLDLRALGYRCVKRVTSPKTTHLLLERS